MATISISTPSDGQTIDAADVNSPLNTIVAAINGNLDDDNIKSGANISGTKLAANTTPLSALDANARGGWITGVLPAPNTVTYNGNRSYDLVFNSTDLTSYISPGMRLRSTRTVAAPTQCTDLESGSSQYYSKTSPAGMTFTDDFVVSAWIKLESYTSSSLIASRYNGTSGWEFYVDANGKITLAGKNGGSGNVSYVASNQSVPLGRWVHVAAQLDMSAFTATTTTSYVMFDGLDVPAAVSRAGTNPTALVQAGNLEIGAENGGSFPFDGKLAQVAIYSAKVTQATIKASMNQALSGSETSLISAYSFNNVITDLNTSNANNLTANGSAVATSADSPFGGQGDGTISSTLDYSIVQKASFSTNTTLVVQVPEGNTLPTSGGITSLAYSPQRSPYGFPSQKSKWAIEVALRAEYTQSSPVQNTWYNLGSWQLNFPVGSWQWRVSATLYNNRGSGNADARLTVSNANNTELDIRYGALIEANPVTDIDATLTVADFFDLSAATTYYVNVKTGSASVASLRILGTRTMAIFTAENAYL